MKKIWWIGVLLVPAAIAPLAFGGCEVTLTCEDGACAASAVAGSTSGAGGAPECIKLPTDPDTHGFPPGVFAVLSKNCYACHTDPPQNGAPQPFVLYDQTQEDYYMLGPRWWSQMREHAVLNKPPSMPFGLPAIPQCEKDILSAWFATCGADTDVGKCECVPFQGNYCSTSSSSTSSSSDASSSASGSSSSGN